ncbi:terminase small subunit [Pontibacter sp. SGAir0037]|uniref:terminase small subunit n=1 Tax=Pontibacter sp. SGAir0037 TaxID=2571030 RepID=UPI0010CD3010|nr:terminase small subunit [Pontibacter sp. SGAir0037]QCR24751.1 terminase small subunit [Pontibacter sp. SGAir0037]
MKGNLNKKQSLFIEEYLKDMNATQAAMRAGYSEKTAMVQGHQLLKKTLVSEEIKRLQAERSDRLQLDTDAVVANLANIAGAVISDFVDFDGTSLKFKDFNTLSREKLAAVESIKQGRFGLEIKLYNKIHASDLILKAIGGYITSSDIIDKLPPERLNNLVDELMQKLNR